MKRIRRVGRISETMHWSSVPVARLQGVIFSLPEFQSGHGIHGAMATFANPRQRPEERDALPVPCSAFWGIKSDQYCSGCHTETLHSHVNILRVPTSSLQHSQQVCNRNAEVSIFISTYFNCNSCVDASFEVRPGHLSCVAAWNPTKRWPPAAMVHAGQHSRSFWCLELRTSIISITVMDMKQSAPINLWDFVGLFSSLNT